MIFCDDNRTFFIMAGYIVLSEEMEVLYDKP